MSEDQRFKVSFDRTDAELEWFWMFAVAVAGKNADTTARGLDRFLDGWRGSPYSAVLRTLRRAPKVSSCRRCAAQEHLAEEIRSCGLGQYKRVAAAWTYSTQFFTDLRGCTLEDLMTCPGVGPKTSRFFLLFTRPGLRYAVLDVHLLRWLARQGVDHVPATTPPAGPRYDRLEEIFLEMCDARGVSPAELDWQIWLTSRQKEDEAA